MDPGAFNLPKYLDFRKDVLSLDVPEFHKLQGFGFFRFKKYSRLLNDRVLYARSIAKHSTLCGFDAGEPVV
jgi:hypothetical protein